MMNFLKENLGGCGFLAASVFLMLYSTAGQSAQAPSQNPMLFPQILLGMMTLFSATLLAGSALGRMRHSLADILISRSLLCGAMVAAYVTAMFVIGFIPATLVFLGSFPFALGYRSRLTVALIAIVGTSAIWWIFTNLLHIFLPEMPISF